MAAGNSARRVITYPEWQPQYEAAVLEADGANLPQRIQAAEAAILRRLQAVSNFPDHICEKEAIDNALGVLRVLRREARP